MRTGRVSPTATFSKSTVIAHNLAIRSSVVGELSGLEANTAVCQQQIMLESWQPLG